MKKEDIIWEELSDLMSRQLLDQLNQEEEIRLSNLMKEYQFSALERRHVAERLRTGREFDSERAYVEFLNYKRRKKTKTSLSVWRIALTSAAAILLFVGIGLIWNMKNQQEIPTLAIGRIEPGKSKAVITLANGQEITLGGGNFNLVEKNGTLLESDSLLIEYKENHEAAELVYNSLSIPVGGEYQLVLADGSKVWLNADSKLKYPVNFVGESRDVYLEGEAYFDVATDREHPFIVHTSRGAVEVLGTDFNVRDYRDEHKVVTTLVQGKVVYRSRDQLFGEVVLEPGFQVEDREDGTLEAKEVDVVLYTGWKDGKYFFENATLEEIMQELTRWYGITVFYKREEVKNLHFTGDLERYKDIGDFLEFMEVGGNVRFSVKGKTIIIE